MAYFIIKCIHVLHICISVLLVFNEINRKTNAYRGRKKYCNRSVRRSRFDITIRKKKNGRETIIFFYYTRELYSFLFRWQIPNRTSSTTIIIIMRQYDTQTHVRGEQQCYDNVIISYLVFSCVTFRGPMRIIILLLLFSKISADTSGVTTACYQHEIYRVKVSQTLLRNGILRSPSRCITSDGEKHRRVFEKVDILLAQKYALNQ